MNEIGAILNWGWVLMIPLGFLVLWLDSHRLKPADSSDGGGRHRIEELEAELSSERAEQQGREWEIAEAEFQRGHAAGRASEQPIHHIGQCAMCDNARVASIEHEPYRPERERYAALESAAREIWSHRFDEVRLPPDIQEQLRTALAALEEAGSA